MEIDCPFPRRSLWRMPPRAAGILAPPRNNEEVRSRPCVSDEGCISPHLGVEVRERAGRTRREPPASAVRLSRFFARHESRNTDGTAVRFAVGEQRQHD